MATVSIPTILRTHTGGEKSVEAKGSTVAEVIDDLDSRHSGLRDRLVSNGSCTDSSTSTSTTRTSGSPAASRHRYATARP